jgi:hypothetical protein
MPKSGGRVKGQPPKITAEVKQSMSEFFAHLTSGSLRWRQCVERILSGVATDQDLRYARDFRAWSEIALDRSLGTPAKAVIEKSAAPTLIFATTQGHLPWSPLAPGATRMDARSAAMNEAKAQELQTQALESGKDPVVIEAGAADAKAKPATADKADEGETLEMVRLPDPPELFNPPPRERDRGR